MVAEDSSVASLHHQQVALLATANGTHIAVQVRRLGAGEAAGRAGALGAGLGEDGIRVSRCPFQRTKPFLPASTHLSQAQALSSLRQGGEPLLTFMVTFMAVCLAVSTLHFFVSLFLHLENKGAEVDDYSNPPFPCHEQAVLSDPGPFQVSSPCLA